MGKVRAVVKPQPSISVVYAKSVTDFGRALLTAINKLQNSESSMKYLDLKHYLYSVFDTVDAVHAFDLKTFFKKAVESGFIVMPEREQFEAVAESLNKSANGADGKTSRSKKESSTTFRNKIINAMKFVEYNSCVDMKSGEEMSSDSTPVVRITNSRLKRHGTDALKRIKIKAPVENAKAAKKARTEESGKSKKSEDQKKKAPPKGSKKRTDLGDAAEKNVKISEATIKNIQPAMKPMTN